MRFISENINHLIDANAGANPNPVNSTYEYYMAIQDRQPISE